MPYYFNLPVITSLTDNQQAALDETESIALSGAPGTGKSVVCLWRHIRNYATDTKESLLLTYTKTLEHYLRESARSQNEEAAENVNRTYWWTSHKEIRKEFDEIIIDEGQDVWIDKYEIIKNYSSSISYGADPYQSVYLSEEQLEKLIAWLKETFSDNEEYEMQKNFRNSKEILEFTQSVFPKILIPADTLHSAVETGLKPIMKITDWDEELELEKMISIINEYASDTHNIGILVPSQKDVLKYFDLINNELDGELECSKFESEMGDFEGLSGIHITTFKSAKGIEFDTVIIPNFDRFDWLIKNTTTISEKDYYVAFTRAKTNLFLICKKNPQKGSFLTYEIE